MSGSIRFPRLAAVAVPSIAVAVVANLVLREVAISSFDVADDAAGIAFPIILVGSIMPVLGNCLGFFLAYRRPVAHSLPLFLAPGIVITLLAMIPVFLYYQDNDDGSALLAGVLATVLPSIIIVAALMLFMLPDVRKAGAMSGAAPLAGGVPPGSAPPPPGYGAPQPAYGAQPGFSGAAQPGASAPPGYGAPPQPSYGTPPQPGYGTPPQPGYGTPPQPGYGAPQPGYATPPQPGFTAAPPPGAPAPPGYPAAAPAPPAQQPTAAPRPVSASTSRVGAAELAMALEQAQQRGEAPGGQPPGAAPPPPAAPPPAQPPAGQAPPAAAPPQTPPPGGPSAGATVQWDTASLKEAMQRKPRDDEDA